jgi:hypothetical protein
MPLPTSYNGAVVVINSKVIELGPGFSLINKNVWAMADQQISAGGFPDSKGFLPASASRDQLIPDVDQNLLIRRSCSVRAMQGCQMVCFQTQNPNLGKF